MRSDELHFSYNWNNKLACQSFTTLRLKNPKKFQVGFEKKIFLKDKFLKTAKIVAIRVFLLRQINEFVAHIDTGYNAEECKRTILTMYKNSNINWDTQHLYFICFLTVKK